MDGITHYPYYPLLIQIQRHPFQDVEARMGRRGRAGGEFEVRLLAMAEDFLQMDWLQLSLLAADQNIRCLPDRLQDFDHWDD